MWPPYCLLFFILGYIVAKLFENVSVGELERLLEAGDAEGPMGYLTEAGAVRRARRWAKANGVFEKLEREFDPGAAILSVRHSGYRGYKRNGDRTSDGLIHQRRVDILQAAMALWLGHPKASVDRLQDLMWAVCDDFTWVVPAHEGIRVDLVASMMGAALCEVLAAVGDRLEVEVVERVRGEIEGRVLTQRDDPSNWWRTSLFNWNHVCNGNIVRAALYIWRDEPKRMAALVHKCVVDMQLALDGFTDDGGCEEGPGYWNYGFGHYASAAYAIYKYTRGKINLMTVDGKIERICRFPLAMNIEGAKQAPFSDTGHGWVPAEVALTINQMIAVPELYVLCRKNGDGRVALGNWTELGLYQGEKGPKMVLGDSLLPEVRMARLRSAPGKHQLTVLATAGNNGANHNHNDIGGFVAYRDGAELITDPGAPTYTAKTFTNQRYEILFCNSLGHSVPVIEGRQQGEGKEFVGTMAAEGLGGRGDKAIVMELAGAYPAGTVESLRRELKVDYKRNGLTIVDAFRFAGEPGEVVEAFITYQPVRVERGGKTVKIGKGGASATLRAQQAGKFKVVEEVEASKEGRTGEVVKRILFVPRELGREMRLGFELV